MKKIMVLVMAAMMCATTYASEKQTAANEVNYEVVLNSEQINDMLGITNANTRSHIARLCQRLEHDMVRARSGLDGGTEKMVQYGVYRNLVSMNEVLTTEQYHLYLRHINELLRQNNLRQFFD